MKKSFNLKSYYTRAKVFLPRFSSFHVFRFPHPSGFISAYVIMSAEVHKFSIGEFLRKMLLKKKPCFIKRKAHIHTKNSNGLNCVNCYNFAKERSTIVYLPPMSLRGLSLNYLLIYVNYFYIAKV